MAALSPPARDGTALAVAVGLTFLLLMMPDVKPQRPAAPPQDATVQISLAAPPAPPALAPPPPPDAPPPPPLAPPPAVPPPPALPALPALAKLPPPAPHTAPARPRPAVQTAVPPRDAPVFDLPANAAASPPSDASAEKLYVAGLHAYLRARTHPPDSAAYRLTHPSGTVEIGFTLDRAGLVHDVAVLRGSGSTLLDRQAVAIVQGGHYPPLPATVFPSEPTHPFHVSIEFRPSGAVDE